MKILRHDLPDHASERDDRALPIDRVGIRGLRYPIAVLDRAHRVQHTVATLNAYVGLPEDFKGTHMSRFVEVLHAYRGDVTLRSLPALLREVQRRLAAHQAYVEVAFPYFLTRRAPVSGAESLMEYPCRFDAAARGDAFEFTLHVQVPVKSLCPCSKAVSDRGAHNQRSLIDVSVRSTGFVWIEDVIEAVEGCASSPLYALLKREDEKYVTEHAYDHPKFVEDLVRDVVLALRALEGVGWLRVAADNQESIHNHSAYAEIEWPAAGAGPRAMEVPAEPPATFGAWLRGLRQDRQLTQQALAERLGVTPSYISRLESDGKAPSAEVLDQLAAALGLDPMVVQLRAGRLPPALMERLARAPERFLALLDGL